MAEAAPFKNVEPRTRQERAAANDKEALEKLRLQQRKGGHLRYDGTGNPIKPAESSPMYADEADRFSRDVAAAEHSKRVQAFQKKEEHLQKVRQDNWEKERNRWNNYETKQKNEEQRFQHLRETGVGGKTNKSSEHFNIINLNYAPTPEGQALKQKDDFARQRAQMRTETLYSKAHSVGHNIITGQELGPPPTTISSTRPW